VFWALLFFIVSLSELAASSSGMFCRRLLIERIPEESIIKPTAVLAVGFGSPNREKTHVGFVCYHHHTTPPSISTTAGSSKYSIKYFKLF